MLPYDQYQSVIFRDGLASTDPTLGMAMVNEPLATGIMPTNVQQGIAPLYNEMVNPNFYENMYNNVPRNLDQKKEAFANNLKTKKQNKGLKALMTGAMSLIPGGNIIRGLAGINPFLQNTDFAQATSLADYLDMRKYGGLEGRETARRMNQREVNEIQGRIDRKQAAGGYDTSQDRNRGQNIPSAPKAPQKTSSSYTTASQDRKKG
jgi:hypothetical protein